MKKLLFAFILALPAAAQADITFSGTGSALVTFTATGTGTIAFSSTTPASGGGGGGGGFASFAHKRTLTINHAQVSTGTLTYTNMAVLISTNDVSLSTTTGSGGRLLNSSGFDLVFTTHSDCSSWELHWDTETIQNVGVSSFTAWVKVPSISSTTDTTFYMCYGSTSITTFQGGASSTWDSNYKGVWHLANGKTLGALDATSNGNNGTITGSTATVGQIDGAGSFNGSQYIDNGTSSSLDIPGDITATAWIKQTNQSGFQGVFSRSNSNLPAPFDYYINPTVPYQIAFVGSDTTQLASNNPIPTGQWNYIGFTVSGNTTTFYINGVPDGTATSSTHTSGGTHRFLIGARDDIGTAFNGTIDEVRISNVARTSDWIKTEYNNQFAPNTFTTIGAEQ